ncbi:MAG TPA: hypothetical protein VJ832_13460 [Variovorax sp.]|jgi:hypothetical protein|nr:hypothetical protein [Variovorax sp.]
MDAFSRPDRTHDPLRAARIVMLPAGIALMLALAGAAFAQGTGEADPAQAKARPSPTTTPTERATARKERQAEGSQAARGPQMGEAERRPTTGPRMSSAERKAADEKRRAANRAANKRGEFARGGNSDAPERRP